MYKTPFIAKGCGRLCMQIYIILPDALTICPLLDRDPTRHKCTIRKKVDIYILDAVSLPVHTGKIHIHHVHKECLTVCREGSLRTK